jgi:hypothetical protein
MMMINICDRMLIDVEGYRLAADKYGYVTFASLPLPNGKYRDEA